MGVFHDPVEFILASFAEQFIISRITKFVGYTSYQSD